MSAANTRTPWRNQVPAVKSHQCHHYDPSGNRTVEQIETTTSGFASSSSSYNDVNQLSARSIGPVLFRGKIDEPGTVTVNGQAATTTQDPDSTSMSRRTTEDDPSTRSGY